MKESAKRKEQSSEKQPGRVPAPPACPPSACPPELQVVLYEFLKDVAYYYERPGHWPLTPDQQAAFIRWVLARVHCIRNGEDYKAWALAIRCGVSP